DMALAAIAQHDGFKKRRPAKIVDVIDLDASLDQSAHGFDMPAFAGWNERRSAIAVGAFEVRAMCKCHLENFKVTACARIKVGTVLDGILGIDVGTSVDQCASDIDMVGVSCGKKRRLSVSATRFQIRSSLDGCVDRGKVTGCRGLKKRSFGMGGGMVAGQYRFGHDYGPCNQCQGTQAEYCLTHRLVLLLVAFIQAE